MIPSAAVVVRHVCPVAYPGG